MKLIWSSLLCLSTFSCLSFWMCFTCVGWTRRLLRSFPHRARGLRAQSEKMRSGASTQSRQQCWTRADCKLQTRAQRSPGFLSSSRCCSLFLIIDVTQLGEHASEVSPLILWWTACRRRPMVKVERGTTSFPSLLTPHHHSCSVTSH